MKKSVAELETYFVFMIIINRCSVCILHLVDELMREKNILIIIRYRSYFFFNLHAHRLKPFSQN